MSCKIPTKSISSLINQEVKMRKVLFFITAVFLFVSITSAFVYAEEKMAININKASVEEIAALPSIGKKTAKMIVEYREKNGGFKKIEDIRKVKGVGKKLFEKIKENITVEDETEKK
jgi:competence protein ComEA